jgi:hypothetical protein
MYGINENDPVALALVKAAQDFLIQYLERDDDEYREHLAEAAADVVLSASYVSDEAKHGLLNAVHKKLELAKANEKANDDFVETAPPF